MAESLRSFISYYKFYNYFMDSVTLKRPTFMLNK